MTNTAATIEPPTPQSVTYDQRTDYTGPVVIAVLAVLLACPLAWLMLVFLFDRAGYDQPERALAGTIITGAGVLIGLAVVVALAFAVGAAFLSRLFEHQETMKKLDVELAEWKAEQQRYLQLTAQSSAPQTGRASNEDQRFMKLVVAVMFQAYDHLAKAGPYKYGDALPWSREQAKAVVLANETEPVGWEMGSRVGAFLKQYEVIKKDGTAWVVNTKRFPDLSSVESLLYRLYDKPVVVNPAPLRDNDNGKFVHI